MKSFNSLENYSDYSENNVQLSRLGITFLAALVLTILPLPSIVADYRPNLVLLIVLYIQCCIPVYFRVTWVFTLGILLDVLSATTIGHHSLAFVITSWAATSKPSNFKYYSILQQMIVILLYCSLYQFIFSLVDMFFAINVHLQNSVFLVIFTVLFWPILRLILTKPFDS